MKTFLTLLLVALLAIVLVSAQQTESDLSSRLSRRRNVQSDKFFKKLLKANLGKAYLRTQGIPLEDELADLLVKNGTQPVKPKRNRHHKKGAKKHQHKRRASLRKLVKKLLKKLSQRKGNKHSGRRSPRRAPRRRQRSQHKKGGLRRLLKRVRVNKLKRLLKRLGLLRQNRSARRGPRRQQRRDVRRHSGRRGLKRSQRRSPRYPRRRTQRRSITYYKEVRFYKFYLNENYKQIRFNILLQYLIKFNINNLEFHNCIFGYNEIKNFNFSNLQKLSFINDIKNFTFDNLSNNNEENNIFKNFKILQKIKLEANLLNDNKLKQLLNITKENKNLKINFKENQLQNISLLQYFIKNNININTKSNSYNIIGIKDDKNLITEDKSILIFEINPFEYKFKQFFQSDNSLELYLLNYTQYMKNLKSSKVIYQFHEILQNNYQALIDILNLKPTPSLDDSFFNVEYYINLLYSAPLFIKDTDDTTLFSVEFDYPMGVFQLTMKKGQFGQTDRRKNNKEQQQQQLMEKKNNLMQMIG
ncbi:hypothetical protein ABK040_016668 [Willaertia magna]